MSEPDEPVAQPDDRRQFRVGLAFMVAAVLVSLLPLVKRASVPAPSPPPAAVAHRPAVPERLQPPDLHARPKLVASAAQPSPVKKSPPRPAKRRRGR